MGNKQQITVIEAEDLIPRYPRITTADLKKWQQMLNLSMAKRNIWGSLDAYSYLNEPTTKQSAAENSRNWKSAFYAMQYSTAPRKLTENLSLAAIASGHTSDGTQWKAKQNGPKSEKE